MIGKKQRLTGRDTANLFDHSLEPAGERNGVSYINDSRAIKVNDTWSSLHALETESKNIVLIIGGQDRGNDYSILKELVNWKVKVLVCLSEESDPVYQIFYRNITGYAKAIDMEEAVRIAAEISDPGDIVLFSPACPSYDVLDNYRNRGSKFKSLIRILPQK
jgi:UDP-N-acetylmuramoylalanine--D-glutamate ligase